MGMVSSIYKHGPEPESNYLANTATWKAVILQAALDAVSNNKKAEFHRAKQEAIRWITEAGKDFQYVCDMADLCPKYVRSRLLRFIAEGGIWRNDKRKTEEKPYAH